MADLVVTDANFKDEVLDSKGLTLIDIWAVWCYPCQLLGPVIEEIANENKSVKVMKMDADISPETTKKYNVMSIPTVMLYKDGELVETFIGVQPKDVYVKAIEKHS